MFALAGDNTQAAKPIHAKLAMILCNHETLVRKNGRCRTMPKTARSTAHHAGSQCGVRPRPNSMHGKVAFNGWGQRRYTAAAMASGSSSRAMASTCEGIPMVGGLGAWRRHRRPAPSAFGPRPAAGKPAAGRPCGAGSGRLARVPGPRAPPGRALSNGSRTPWRRPASSVDPRNRRSTSWGRPASSVDTPNRRSTSWGRAASSVDTANRRSTSWGRAASSVRAGAARRRRAGQGAPRPAGRGAPLPLAEHARMTRHAPTRDARFTL